MFVGERRARDRRFWNSQHTQLLRLGFGSRNRGCCRQKAYCFTYVCGGHSFSPLGSNWKDYTGPLAGAGETKLSLKSTLFNDMINAYIDRIRLDLRKIAYMSPKKRMRCRIERLRVDNLI